MKIGGCDRKVHRLQLTRTLWRAKQTRITSIRLDEMTQKKEMVGHRIDGVTLTQIDLFVRLPKWQTLHYERIMPANCLNVYFILQLEHRIVSNDLRTRHRKLSNKKKILNLGRLRGLTCALLSTFRAYFFCSWTSITRWTTPNAPRAIAPLNSYFDWRYSFVTNLNCGKNINITDGVGQLVFVCAAKLSPESFVDDLNGRASTYFCYIWGHREVDRCANILAEKSW